MASGFQGNTFNVQPADGDYRIVAAMNIRFVSWKMSGATDDAATLTGNRTIKNADGVDQPSEAIAIVAGEEGTILPQSPSQPVDGWTFNVTQGTLKLIMV